MFDFDAQLTGPLVVVVVVVVDDGVAASPVMPRIRLIDLGQLTK